MNDENQGLPPVETPLNVPLPVSPVLEQVVTPQPNNNFSKKRVIIYVIVLLLAFILIIYVLLQGNKTEPKIPQPTPTPTIALTSTPTIAQEQIIMLKKDQETAIPNSTLSAVFKGVVDPPSNCIDCGSTITVDIKTSTQSKELIFVCGGIAGVCAKNLSFSGYIFNLGKTVDPQELELSIRRE